MDLTLLDRWGLDRWGLDRLAQPWLLPVAAVLILACLLLGLRRRSQDAAFLVVAARLRSTRRWRRLVRRRRAVAILGLVLSLVAAAGAAWGAARPQGVVVETPVAEGRDVVLCLDSSSSMDRDNLEIVDAYSRLVDDLEGDRVAFVMWSGAAVTLVPLTSDRRVIQAELRRFAEATQGSSVGDGKYFTGTELMGLGASNISNGLVSCLDRLDLEDPERSRAVVIASDNDPSGRDEYTLDQAAAIAREREAVVYAIAASRLSDDRFAAQREEFKRAVESTGGVFAVPGGDPGVAGDAGGADVATVVQGIDELEEARSRRQPQRFVGDDLDLARSLASVGVLGLVVLWTAPLVPAGWRRVRRRAGGGGSP